MHVYIKLCKYFAVLYLLTFYTYYIGELVIITNLNAGLKLFFSESFIF